MILISLIPTKIELYSASFWSTSGAHLGIHPHVFPASFWRSLNWTLLWLWHQAAPNNLPGSPSLGSPEVLAVLNHPVRDPQCGFGLKKSCRKKSCKGGEPPGIQGSFTWSSNNGASNNRKSMGWILRDLPFGVTNCTLNTQIAILVDPSSTLVSICCFRIHPPKPPRPKVKDESFGANLRTKAPSLKDGPGSISRWP